MRVHLLGLILLAGVSVPVAAQQVSVERRVDRLEQQLRAVQRRVFPNGTAQFVQPEIGAEAPAGAGPGPSGDALTSLTQRVDALETQLRTLTGQVEENGYRTRQLEEQVTRLRADFAARADAPARPAETRPEPRPEPPVQTPPAPRATAPSVPATAEEAYNAGYRLWDQRHFAEAEAALEAAATRYPGSRWTSWMRNLQGRAYLDDGKPATAARVLLANYQDNAQGERAADSLYYLGQALTRLDRRPEACRVYDELVRVYPDMRGEIRARLPEARTAARCTAASTTR